MTSMRVFVLPAHARTWRLDCLCGCVLAAACMLQGCRKEQGKPGQAASQPASATSPSTPSAVSADLVAINNRGVGLMGRFDYDQALQAFERARAIAGGGAAGEADVLVNLAIATLNRQREGDAEAALKILAEAQRLDAANLRAVYCEAILRLYLQSPDLAQPLFARVAQQDPGDAYAAYYLGQCLAQQRQ